MRLAKLSLTTTSSASPAQATARPQMEPVERGCAAVRQGNELSGGRLAKIRNVEQRQLGDPCIDRGHAGDCRQLVDTALFGARRTVAKTSANR